MKDIDKEAYIRYRIEKTIDTYEVALSPQKTLLIKFEK